MVLTRSTIWRLRSLSKIVSSFLKYVSAFDDTDLNITHTKPDPNSRRCFNTRRLLESIHKLLPPQCTTIFIIMADKTLIFQSVYFFISHVPTYDYHSLTSH